MTRSWSTAPAASAAEVTPDNDEDLPTEARALYVGGAGNVAIITQDGSAAGNVLSVNQNQGTYYGITL